MEAKDVLTIFKELGWTLGKDEVGDDYCEYNLGGFTLSVMPKVKELTTDKVLRISYSLSYSLLTKAVSVIKSKKTSYEPFAVDSRSIRAVDFTRDDILSVEKKIVVWGKSQPLDDVLEEYREKCPDRPGLRQVYHLAALAIVGDVQKLAGYQLSFERGETLNFAPMIKKEMIDSAIELAKLNLA